MKKNQILLVLIFKSISNCFYGQEINAIVKDSLSLEPVPFASIYFKKGKGVITNEEGFFRMQYDSLIPKSDSLFFSCMGYKTIGFPLEKFTLSKLSFCFMERESEEEKTTSFASIFVPNKPVRTLK